MAARDVLTTGKTHDMEMAGAAREIHLLQATRDITIKVVHKPGKTLILADALSRAPIDISMHKLAMHLVRIANLKFVIPHELKYVISTT